MFKNGGDRRKFFMAFCVVGPLFIWNSTLRLLEHLYLIPSSSDDALETIAKRFCQNPCARLLLSSAWHSGAFTSIPLDKFLWKWIIHCKMFHTILNALNLYYMQGIRVVSSIDTPWIFVQKWYRQNMFLNKLYFGLLW